MISHATEPCRAEQTGNPSWHAHVAEVAVIVALILLVAGTPAPDVNEAHYLAKAKRYWDPGWCGPDIFLDSAAAHGAFYGLFGWPTRWLSLGAMTWCGRLGTWVLVAWAWQRLSWAILPSRYVSVLTAAWFLMLTRYGHLAGEWAVGGFEAKSVAYVCVFGGLRALALQRWAGGWAWFGAATAMHVLVGGWSMVAAALAWLLSGPTRPALRCMGPGLLVGGGLALAGLLPAWRLSAGVAAATAAEANLIYVFGRLSHHLVFHLFAPRRLALFGSLLLAWVLLARLARRCEPWSRLHGFAVGALTISVLGIFLDLALLCDPTWAARVLRFYWFRLSDVAVPLVVSLAVPLVLRRWESRGHWAVRALWAAAVLAPMLLLGSLYVDQQRDFRPGGIVQSSPRGAWTDRQQTARYRAWQDACRWIDQHTEPHARFLTPRHQQTFKWYAQRAEVACWKDIPQDASSIVAWWRLLHEIYPPAVVERGLGAWSDERLLEIVQREQVDYIVVDRGATRRRLGFPRLYPASPREEGWFEVYRAGSERPAGSEVADSMIPDHAPLSPPDD